MPNTKRDSYWSDGLCAVVVSDDEDFIEESPSLDMSVTPSGTSTVVLSSNGSSVSTPVLPTRHLQELDMLPREICADSSESVPLSSRQVCLDFTQLIFQPPALLPTDGTTEIAVMNGKGNKI